MWGQWKRVIPLDFCFKMEKGELETKYNYTRWTIIIIILPDCIDPTSCTVTMTLRLTHRRGA